MYFFTISRLTSFISYGILGALGILTFLYLHDAYLAKSFQRLVIERRSKRESLSKNLSPNDNSHNSKIDISSDYQLLNEYKVAYYLRPGIVPLNHNLAKQEVFVFLHGLGGQMSQFQKVMSYFPPTACLFSFDYWGCGLSRQAFPNQRIGSVDQLTTKGLSKLTYKVLEKLFPENTQFILIGHSMGATIASRVSKMLQTRCTALLLLNPKIRFTSKEISMIVRLRKTPNAFISLYRLLDRFHGLRSSSVTRSLSKNIKGDGDAVRAQLWLWNRQSNTKIWKTMLMGLEELLEPGFHFPKCPILILFGEFDPVSSLKDKVFFQDYPGNYTFKEIDTGHCSMLEQPSEVYNCIDSFLDKFLTTDHNI
ncbi:Abhydrolase domain-containing protein C57A10.08c [Schizosaccharomyces pombe]